MRHVRSLIVLRTDLMIESSVLFESVYASASNHQSKPDSHQALLLFLQPQTSTLKVYSTQTPRNHMNTPEMSASKTSDKPLHQRRKAPKEKGSTTSTSSSSSSATASTAPTPVAPEQYDIEGLCHQVLSISTRNPPSPSFKMTNRQCRHHPTCLRHICARPKRKLTHRHRRK